MSPSLISGNSLPRVIAFVGSYGAQPDAEGGGVYVLNVGAEGANLEVTDHIAAPVEAGYLVYSQSNGILYVVDERKTDGRGPVSPPAAVHALSVNQVDGSLTQLNWQSAPGPRPTFLSYSAKHRLLVSANHGDFQHVEKVARGDDGTWSTEYVYDDSTVIVYGITPDGGVGAIKDLVVFEGHGLDPNKSPQNAGHAQASPHAHCAVLDPSEKYVLVCDKGTDRIYVYALGSKLELVSVCQFPQETAPRHIAFSSGTRLYLTLELSSELAALDFCPESGVLTLVSRVSTVSSGFSGLNEPAEVRAHPNGRFVYVNNRGEDSLAWFDLQQDAGLVRMGAVQLAKSLHPGLAARSFSFDPSGTFMLVADRPAHLVGSYAVSGIDGSLTHQADVAVPDPAYIEFAELPSQPLKP